jgi:DNA helicase-2/ATP-dependent DNA helicase PcrA
MPLNLDHLNPEQREAVQSVEGPLLVLAGAGTGKTSVITHRMAYMIQEGVAPSAILALTFTNKAAREMKERTLRLTSGLPARDNGGKLFAGTFHSFCVRLLRRYADRVGYRKNFSIYSESDQMDLLKEIMVESGVLAGRKEVRAALAQLSREKNAFGGPASSDRIANKYQQALRLRNAVDFDDLLLLALQLLKTDAAATAEIRNAYTHILIDEYQDTNQLQFEIVRRLGDGHHNVCVVGDDDQSIYSWRGAESRHILEFEKHFPGAHVVRLEQNYRCTPRILQAANAVIKNNARRHAKRLWARGDEGSQVRLVEASNDNDEAAWIASDLLEGRQQGRLPWEEVGILYRANHLSRTIEQELRKMRIPYEVVGGQEFFERREVKDLLAYLQVMLNPDDDNQLLRIINKPARGIGKTSLEAVIQACRQAGHSIWKEIHETDTPYLPIRARAAFDSFCQMIGEYRPRFLSEEGGWAESARRLIEELAYEDELTRTSKDAAEASSRRENVQEFLRSLDEYERAAGPPGAEAEPPGLGNFIDAMLLRDKEDQNEDKKDEQEDGFGVKLMTLHSAKGLEFKRVYIIGVEEGLLPHDRVKLEGNVDEERRLFYVGLTRARELLTLSYCSSRRRYGQDEPCHPSAFLEELPEEVLERIHADSVHEIASVEKTTSSLEALRARLEQQSNGK